MTKLIAHPNHPEIQFTPYEAKFLLWVIENAPQPLTETAMQEFMEKVHLAMPKTDGTLWSRFRNLLDIAKELGDEAVAS